MATGNKPSNKLLFVSILPRNQVASALEGASHGVSEGSGMGSKKVLEEQEAGIVQQQGATCQSIGRGRLSSVNGML